jgi:hypothetical protein
MFGYSGMAHSVREEAIKVVCRVSSFLNIVVEYDCFANNLRIDISVLGNEELKVSKVAK